MLLHMVQYYKSVDGGQSWLKQLGFGNSSSYYNNVEVTSNGIVYATLSSDGTDKGIWTSLDGQTWKILLIHYFLQYMEE